MSHNAIDYFALLGRTPGPFVCESFPLALDEDSAPLSGREIWNEAITDVIVVGPDDPVEEEETWTFLPESVSGAAVEPPHIAFRRRKHSRRLDHITQVKFVSNPDNAGDGFEVVRTTLSGKASAQIKGVGYIAFRRAAVSAQSLIDGEPLLCDLCVTKKSLREELPEKFVVVERDVSLTMGMSLSSSDLVFAVRTLPAMGLINLAYKPATIDRYPLVNQKGIELPEEALPVFAFPRHLRLQQHPLNEYPLPVYFTFVFTDQEGHHMYAACLKFFEKVPLSELQHVAQEIYGEDVVLEQEEDKGIFCPKVVCLLSSMPFYRAMRRYLRHLYSLSLSSSVCPLEHFVTSVVAQVPLPVPGGRAFHVVLDAALISSTSKPMSPVVFELPALRSFPLMDLDFAGPMRCLTIDVMLCVYILMLREAKLLFVSCSNALLTETMETLRALLFPLSWPCTFVSRLPAALSGLLQAPGGFMLGLHVDPAEQRSLSQSQTLTQGRQRKNNNSNNSSNNNNCGTGPGTNGCSREEMSAQVRRFLASLPSEYPLVAGTYVVDLSSSALLVYNGKQLEALTNTQTEALLRTVPLGPRLRIYDKLRGIAEDYGIAPQRSGLEELDSAFDFNQHAHSMHSHDSHDPHSARTHMRAERKSWEAFPTLEVRDAFLSLTADLLGDYTKYMIEPPLDLRKDTFRTFKEQFAVSEYVRDSDASCRTLTELLTQTQMFAVLLQQRAETHTHAHTHTAQALVFFERAAALQRALSLSCGGHSAASANVCVCALPAPLHTLLRGEEEWAGLSAVMQQQILQHGHTQAQSAQSSSQTQTQAQTHKLVGLSVSALSPLRSLSQQQSGPVITQTQLTVTNTRLLHLLHYLAFSGNTPLLLRDNASLENSESDTNSTRFYALARTELDTLTHDLYLGSAECGPLLLPGPVLCCERVCTPSEMLERERERYAYPLGWPSLTRERLVESERETHRRVRLLREERLFTLRHVDPHTQLLIRSPSERLATETLRLTTQHQQSVMSGACVAMHYALSPMVSAALDIASVSVCALALRAVSTTNAPSARTSAEPRSGIVRACLQDALQLLGVCAQLDQWGVSSVCDESLWRALLVVCAAVGGDLMRCVAMLCARRMEELGVTPDALTHGQFLRAVASTELCARDKRLLLSEGEIVSGSVCADDFLFLEELGLAWYTHKPSRSPRHSATHTHSRTRALSASDATQRIVSELGLRCSEGFLPFHFPQRPVRESVSERDSEREYLQKALHNRLTSVLSLTHIHTKSPTQTQTQTDTQALTQAGVPPLTEQGGNEPPSDVHSPMRSTQSMMSRLNAIGSQMMRVSQPSQHSHTHKHTHPHTHTASHSHANTPKNTDATPVSPSPASGSGSMWNMSSLIQRSKTALSLSSLTQPQNSQARNTPRNAPLTPCEADMEREKTASEATSELDDARTHTESLADTHTETDTQTHSLQALSATLVFDDDEDDGRESLSVSAHSASTQLSPSPSPSPSHVHAVSEDAQGETQMERETQADAQADTQTDAQVDSPTNEEESVSSESSSVSCGGDESERVAAMSESASVGESEDNTDTPTDVPTDKESTERAALHTRVCALLAHTHAQRARCVAMHSRSECVCGFATMDEELLSVWCHGAVSVEAHRQHQRQLALSHAHSQSQPHSPSQRGSESESVCESDGDSGTISGSVLSGVHCQHCGRDVLPQLTVRCYAPSDPLADDTDSEVVSPLRVVWEERVAYLSPAIVRYELEETVLQVGQCAAHTQWLHTHRRALYWNVVWYATRCHLPTGLIPVYSEDFECVTLPDASLFRSNYHDKLDLSQSSKQQFGVCEDNKDLDAPVVVGWRESVARKKALNVLSCSHTPITIGNREGTEEREVDVSDVLPNLSSEDIRCVREDVLPQLDGSPASLRLALLSLSRCVSLFDEAQLRAAGDSRERALYVSLLALAVHFGKFSLYDKTKSGFNRDIAKECTFHRAFLDCIRCVLSQKDCEEMNVDNDTLLECAKDYKTGAVRAVFGLML